MSEFCDFCGISHATSYSRNVEDTGLMVSTKFNEAFKVNLPENFKIICCDCINKLDESYDFYQQVQGVIQLLSKVKPEVVEHVEVKVEDPELLVELNQLSAIELSTWMRHDDIDQSFEIDDIVSPEKKKPVTLKRESQSKPQATKSVTSQIKPLGKRHRDPGHRSRGLRVLGPVFRYTMSGIFKNEIQKNLFYEPPETLNVPAADKLDDGTVTTKALAKVADKTWSDFWWNCNEEDCSETFSNIMDLKDHLRVTHQKPNFVSSCIDCGKATLNHTAYINHAMTHNPNLRFCCLFCSEFRHNFVDLYHHYINDHMDRKFYFCLYCGRNENSITMVNTHVIKRHRIMDANIECDICGFKAVLKYEMAMHMASKHKDEAIPCDLCSRICKTMAKLSEHKKNVHNESRPVCFECGKAFCNSRLLTRHIKQAHTEVSPQVSCKVCSRVFPTVKHLKSHMLVHDPSEGKYNCSYCPRNFKRLSGMKIHVRCAHTGEKPYKCCMPDCTLLFYDYPNCLKHIRSTHESEGKPLKV